MKSWIYMTGVIAHVQWRGNHNDHGILYFSEEPTSHYGMTDLYYNVGWSLQEVYRMLFHSWRLSKNIFDGAIRMHPLFLSMYRCLSLPVSLPLFSLSLSHTLGETFSPITPLRFSHHHDLLANPLVPAKMYNCDRFMLIIGRFGWSQYHPLFTYRPKPMIDRQYAPHVRIMISSANINTAHAWV